MSTPVKNQRRRHADSGFLQINYNKEAFNYLDPRISSRVSAAASSAKRIACA